MEINKLYINAIKGLILDDDFAFNFLPKDFFISVSVNYILIVTISFFTRKKVNNYATKIKN